MQSIWVSGWHLSRQKTRNRTGLRRTLWNPSVSLFTQQLQDGKIQKKSSTISFYSIERPLSQAALAQKWAKSANLGRTFLFWFSVRYIINGWFSRRSPKIWVPEHPFPVHCLPPTWMNVHYTLLKSEIIVEFECWTLPERRKILKCSVWQ